MSDHRAVQETETAAAGKVSELTEAMIRVLLQQRAEQAKQPPGDPDLFRSFYQAYQENGVDNRTARDAAADAAMGLGSKDSPAMAKAEAQAISHAQEYRSVTATAVDPNATTAVQQQANARRKGIERSLGIQDQPLAVRAQTINGLDPNQAQAALKTTYRTALEQNGASPQTAAAASKDLSNNRGAADSPATAQAHQEIHQHNVLKHMYQGVFEKHRVSPEVSAAAADQLARGNGANRSVEVRRAHKQALANIKNPQRVSSVRTSELTAKETNAAYPAEMNGVQDRPTTKVERSQDNSPAQRIWDKYSPGENGVFESMAKGNPKMQQMSDQLIAKDALLAGEDPKVIQQAIAQNSPHAKTLSRPGDYARRTVKKAEQAEEVQSKRAQQNGKAQNARPGRKEAQQRQANQTRRLVSKTQPKKKVKARNQGMSY